MITPKLRFFKKVNRKAIRNTYENKSNRLRYGTFGVQAIEKGFLKVKQIEAVRRTITGRLKRKVKVWIRAFPDYPRTAKPKEVRMGRGKGSVSGWNCIVKPGRILFEVICKDKKKLKEVLDFTLRKFPLYVQVVSRNIYL